MSGLSCVFPQAMPALRQSGELAEPALDARCGGGVGVPATPAEVIAHGDLLWVRGVDGSLVSLAPAHGVMAQHLGAEHVVDVHRSARGALWALTYDAARGDLRVWRRKRGVWSPLVQLASLGEARALSDVGGAPVVFSEHAVSVRRARGTEVRRLSRRLSQPVIGSAVTEDGVAYLADAGGLWRVSLDSGAVAQVYDGALSAVVRDHDDPRCVLASDAGGALLEACGASVAPSDRVARAAQRHWSGEMIAVGMLFPEGSPERERWLGRARSQVPDGALPEEPHRPSPAVFGLASARGGLYAVTSDAMYRPSGSAMDRSALPELELRCGIHLGRADNTWVVATADGRVFVAPDPRRAAAERASLARGTPCDDTVLYYGHGYQPGAELDDGGYGVVLSCRAGEVTMLERGERHPFSVPAAAWETLWADLERARWRDWGDCGGDGDASERLVISRGEHSLRVACSGDRMTVQQRALMQRMRALAADTRPPL